MKITFCQFKGAITVGGKYTTITSWSADKHTDIGIEIASSWVVLTLPDKSRRRIPITEVGYVSEVDDGEPKKAVK